MTKKINTGLGKGLGALLPSSIEFSDKGFKFADKADSANESDIESHEPKVAVIEIDKIVHNPYQPRKEFDPIALEELKNSILEHGVITAITVRKSVNGYELISGERRLRASIAAGLKTIPAYVLEVNSDVAMLEIALIENVQRENLNPIEVAAGYNRLIEECNLTQEQVAQKVGKDRSTIANLIRLLRLPERIQDSLRNKEISMGHAKALLSLSSPQKMILAWREILDKDLSVRATETLAKDIETGKFKSEEEKKETVKPKPVISPEIMAIVDDNEKNLRYVFGTQVRIVPKNKESGKIEIEFYSIDDFERIVDIINSKSTEQ